MALNQRELAGEVYPLHRVPSIRPDREDAAAPLTLLTAEPDAVVGASGSRRGILYDRYGKRALDIAIVLALAPLWVPLYGIVAITLLVAQGRPLHFSSLRTGKGCEAFSILKFRTMRTDAAEVLKVLLSERPDLAMEYEITNKLKEDPRISPVGAVLRKTSLDELPQLWNVLKGDMSLVGPRPPSTLADTAGYYGALAPHVFRDRPGLTGLWQVSERHQTTYERKVWLDLVYASRCSLATDLKLLARTIPTVVFGRGAF